MTTGTDHARYAEWDGAYVLGALSAAERAEFETHLAGCPECRDAVAELTARPGLMSRLSPVDAFAMLETDAVLAPRVGEVEPAPLRGSAHAGAGSAEPGPAPLPLTRRLARRKRLHRTLDWTVGGVAVLAAAAVAAAVVLPLARSHEQRPTASFALSAPSATVIEGLSADVSLTPHGATTGVWMSCDYSAPTSAATAALEGYDLALYVTDAHGDATRISSWNTGYAGSAHAFDVDGSVKLPASRIANVEIRDVDTGEVVLEGHPGDS